MLIDPGLAREALDAALASGGERAEIFAERTAVTGLKLEGGRLEDAMGGVDAGVGISLEDGGLIHFANGNRLDRDGLLLLARRLAGAVERTRTASAAPPAPRAATVVSPVAVAPSEVAPTKKVESLRRAESAARRHDPRIAQVTCTYRDTLQEVVVAASDGLFAADRRVIVTLHVAAVARDRGRIRTGTEIASGTRGFELLDIVPPESIGREAARQAVLQLGAEPAPSGTFTVVLSSRAGGTMIHEACGHGLEADFIEKGLSAYAGRRGEQVASPLVTVVDDGTLSGRRGSSAIDDEGAATGRVVLIERGILRGRLHSRATSRRAGEPPTGNGRRESYRHLPIPRMRNTMILPGDADPEEIVRGVADGILVCRMGGGEVDVATGNFVFNCLESYRIRGGRRAEPLRDATLVGNGPEVLATIDAVGSDLGFGVGTCGKEGQGVPVSDAQPTLRIPAIVVGGTRAEVRPAGRTGG